MATAPVVAIVDDDDGIRSSVSSLIRSAGYDAETYASAVEFLGSGSASDPDCMIADIQMPVITGDQLQDQLNASGRRFPIIFMTAHPTDEIRAKVMAGGAIEFLVKPADGDVLLSCVESALERGRPQ